MKVQEFLPDSTKYADLSEPGPSGLGALGAKAPPIVADQLTLSQPGGQIMPATVLRAPPDFQTLRRPCNVRIDYIRGTSFDV